MDPVGGLIFGVGLLFLAGVLQTVKSQVSSGTLTRNSAVGIRTKATQSSDAAWEAGHRAAGPWLLASSITGAAAGVTAIVVAVALLATGGENPAVIAVPSAGLVAMMALLVTAAVKADSSAKNADS